MGNSERQGKKKEKMGSGIRVALKAYPEYAHLPMDSQRLTRYSLRAARCTRSDTRQLLGRGGQTGPNAEHSRPRLPLVRLSPATLDGCVRLFPLFFKVAFLKQDPDDLATGKLVVPGDNVNGCLDVHEHIAHARPFLSFSVELGEVASHDISLPGRSQL